MNQRLINLILIFLILAISVWIIIPDNPGIKIGNFERSLDTILGLDLQGGLQVLLQVDMPEDSKIDPQSLQDAKQILENRSNALGVSEVLFQVAGNNRIVGEFPGLTNTEEVLKVLKQTGQLEFVEFGDVVLEPGTTIKTDIGLDTSAIPGKTTNGGESKPVEEKIWHTVMTGNLIKSVGVNTNSLGQFIIEFELENEGPQIFKEFTSNNVGKILAIVLDKTVISTPRIENAITDGSGIITGNFTYESTNSLAVQLRYGSLPIPLKVAESRVIGPTLGQDSLQKSLLAGVIGLIIVALFMIIYYRLPGVVAVFSIIIYGCVTFALFKFIPVTMTLPAIAGFLLSTGGALDANILIIERLKEELRSGKSIKNAVFLSWKRAWPSIRDSNAATIITSAILFWFASAYGASIVKGFALTLAIGVVISLISAVLVSRTFLGIVMDWIKPSDVDKMVGL